jgi:hypothetical protein
MSKLTDRYPQVQRVPTSNTQPDEVALLKLLEPYLGWTLAEIDTGTSDILICDANLDPNGRAQHLVLLSGRAVSVWLQQHQRHTSSNNDVSTPDNTPPESS